MNDAVLVTGAAGGIGQAIVATLMESYHVVSIDARLDGDHWPFDITSLEDEATRGAFYSRVQQDLSANGCRLKGLVNNAAVQILGGLAELDVESFEKTMRVNVTAPLVLSRMFAPDLSESGGSIVNIGSIHATLTKPGFVSYATSKAALAGLTRALAVDLCGRIRVNCIEPAAISTPMLMAGFEGAEEKYELLQAHHPSGRIGEPSEVASLVRFLISDDAGFLNGCSIGLDGAISHRLHDPA